jgi:hypothetical protein
MGILIAAGLPAQAASRTLTAVDECANESSFGQFRASLAQAAERKDRAALMELVAPDVRTNFNGVGKKGFAEAWDYSAETNWEQLKYMLTLGCARAGDARVIPSFSVQFSRLGDSIDQEKLELTREEAKLLKVPEYGSPAIATLSWEMVTAIGSGGDDWTEVRLADGREGWISDAELYHPSDIHLVARMHGGTWKISEYVYGPWED